MSTKIEWVRNPDGTQGETWNPIAGCNPCSIGCINCWACRMTHRLAHNPKTPQYAGLTDEQGHWTGEVRFFPERLDQPLHWKKPRRVFVCSMSDLFHESSPMRQIRDVFDAMKKAPQHTYILLTKHADYMAAALRVYSDSTAIPDNWWLGVTVCNQDEADAKIPVLLQTPTVVRFVSIEPMLGPIDLNKLTWYWKLGEGEIEGHNSCLSGKKAIRPLFTGKTSYINTPKLDWVIVGAETGPGARPMHPEWARSVRDQCRAACVPFFYKRGSDGSRLLDGQPHEECPE